MKKRINKRFTLNKKVMLFSFLGVFIIAIIIVLIYGNLNSLMNNSVEDSSVGTSPYTKSSKEILIEKLTSIAKNRVGDSGGEYRKFYWNEDNGYDWCAAFIWWLFNQDEESKDLVLKRSTADDLVRDSVAANLGTWHEDNCTDVNTKPQAGDLIVFDPEYGNTHMYIPYSLRATDKYPPIDGFNTRDKYLSSHIGFVYQVDNDGTVHTIEGNKGGVVVDTYYSKDFCGKNESQEQRINGYYRPNYNLSRAGYTIKYNANATDAKGSMQNQSYNYGELKKLTSNNFTRSNYVFKNWVAQNDNGLLYCYLDSSKKNVGWIDANTCKTYGYYYFSNGQQIQNLYKNGGVVTMFAQWVETKNDNSNTQNSSSNIGVKTNEIKTNKFTVKFYSNCNNCSGSMKDQKMTYGANERLNPVGYTKFGYVFDYWVAQRGDGLRYCYTSKQKTSRGWFDANTCAINGYYRLSDRNNLSTLVGPGETVKMYAHWKRGEFTVKFNSNCNNCSGSMKVQKMTYGVDNVLNSVGYTKPDYAFDYWIAQRWDDKRYCYTDNSKQSADWVQKNVCDKYGYFKFWNNIKLSTTVPPGKTVSMYAHWRPTKFTVKFYSNCNNCSGSMGNQKMTYGVDNVLNSVAYTKPDYVFDYWIAQRDDGLRYCYVDSSKTRADWAKKDLCDRFGYFRFWNNIKLSTTVLPGKTVSMYAHWKPSKFLVSYDAGGGTGFMKNQYITYGSPQRLYSNGFKRANYMFIGWHAQREDGKWYCYTSPSKSQLAWRKSSDCNFDYYLYKNNQSVSNVVQPGSFVKMVAQWKREYYIIKYYPSGGTGNVFSQRVNYGDSTTLALSNFKRNGYILAGWHAKRANGTWYCYISPSHTDANWVNQELCENFGYYTFNNGATVKNLSSKGAEVSMYAQWQKVNSIFWYPTFIR